MFGAVFFLAGSFLGFSIIVSSALLQFFDFPPGIQFTGPFTAVFILVGLLILPAILRVRLPRAQNEGQARIGLSGSGGLLA